MTVMKHAHVSERRVRARLQVGRDQTAWKVQIACASATAGRAGPTCALSDFCLSHCVDMYMHMYMYREE